jgi:hypothetical protein
MRRLEPVRSDDLVTLGILQVGEEKSTTESGLMGRWNSYRLPETLPRPGGEPKVYAHVVVGKADGTAHGGYLLEAHCPANAGNGRRGDAENTFSARPTRRPVSP